MSYLKFDKQQLVNLEYSLQREFLRTNRAGSYSSSTLAGCNTRKYHGLLVTQLNELDGGRHVLLSSLDETVIQHDAEFNLGIHKFPGDHYEPRGHKYLRDIEFNKISKLTYRVGGVILSRERILVEKEEQLLIRYTLEDAHSPTKLRFKPFLAFRNVHTLSKANMFANTRFVPVENGIKMRLYEGYPFLHMQFSKEVDFVPVPDWYFNIEYMKEQKRGYEFHEDLFVPGYFELPIEKGESIVFSASTAEEKPSGFKRRFTNETKKRTPRDSFSNSLLNSAQQFLCMRNDGDDIIAGYPWYESIPRQTFLAINGILLRQGNLKTYESILKTHTKRLKDGLFPKYVGAGESDYDAADAPLLFFVSVQELNDYVEKKELWEKYGPTMKKILANYRKGTRFNIHMQDNGLIHAKAENVALTWMDAYVEGKPVTPRGGLAVEINALWYNAVSYALELAEIAGDHAFVEEWKDISEKIAASFQETFWCDEEEYLADYVDGDYKDWSVRPNMLFAAWLSYSPLSREQKKAVISRVKNELLTTSGLRSLSPKNQEYLGICDGDLSARSLAMHQGTVYPFFIGPFVKAYIGIHKMGGMSFVKNVMESFEEEMTEHCIGTLSEMYDGNPPHEARGAVSQAWNVGSILSAISFLDNYEE
ncbi:amylo-alpha-1,6-glucosidase [Prolixibacter sp. NT017]|uniref:amylo-alpha-1,6-glucosidase n=1 Tax=Prolixibacter sp. NT017 TaxID=2652390 RepID=UPI0012724584|nr:amylo-alpha-1,6-glucosidase [Prolixibacter sp. NT017]GET27509.1 4-alpha-glucanotransferase [Prolixibacter sp. NT017]